MNFFLKQKLWFFIAVFFMVVTVTLLVGMWHKKGKHNNHNKSEENYRVHEDMDKHHSEDFSLTNYLVKELALNAEQTTKLEAINSIIENKKDSLSEQNEISKEFFNTALYAYNSNKNRQDSLIKCMSSFTEAFNRTRVEHIDKIKAICTEEQKKKLPEVLNNLKEMNFKRKKHHNKHH